MKTCFQLLSRQFCHIAAKRCFIQNQVNMSYPRWSRNYSGTGHGRGQGGYRGNRHGRNEYNEGGGEERGYRGHSRRDEGSGHGSHRGGGRPPGLRGKEIGMYFAKKSKNKKIDAEYVQRPLVAFGGKKEADLEKLLHNVRAADNVTPQPSRSYAPIDSMEDDRLSDTGSSLDPVPTNSGNVLHQDRSTSLEAEMEVEATETEDELEKPEMPRVNDILNINAEERAFIDKDQLNDTDEGNAELDEKFHREFTGKQEKRTYKSMMAFRKKLPSYNMVDEIVNTVNSNQVTVISGETGCGKTTQVPQFILDDYINKGMGTQCRIICTQPRRISAVSVAERVADERDEKVGNGGSVGYSIRLERKLPRQSGSILFCTTGILLKYLEVDPLLRRTTHIVIDEIHERDLLSDFLMIILKDILPVRPELKIILMSATLRSEQFSAYFNNCPMLNIPGFTYPVKEYLLEDVIEMTGYMPPPGNKKQRFPRGRKRGKDMEEQQWNLEAWSRSLEGKYSPRTIQALQNVETDKVDCDMIACLIRHICLKMEEGAILVFVPGWSEISKVNKILLADTMFNSDKFLILPLHSLMPTVNQKQVFDTPPPGVRKIIIATNIAETSITINDVVHVIDCGKIKVKDYVPEMNLSTLDAQWVSKANARQRRGRAGRVKSGNCFHLYSSLQEMELRDYLPPEILRTRLEELCLKVKLLKLGKIKPFVDKAMEKPSAEALEKSIVILQDLKALDGDENLLPLGYHLARMPVDPHSGKMILFGAMFGCLDPICTIAASLSFKDAFVVPLNKEAEADKAKLELSMDYKSDHIMLVNAFDGWERAVGRGTDRQYCWDYFLSSNTLRLLRDMKKQFAELLYDIGFVRSKNSKDPQVNMNANNADLVKAILCAGLYPNVAKVGKIPKRFDQTPKLQLKDHLIKSSSYIHPRSVNAKQKEFNSKWMIYHKLMKTSVVYAFDTTMVSPYPLLFFGGNITTEHDTSHSEYQGNCVIVDDWIKFWASPKTASLVNELRQKLDEILESKITNPSLTDWTPNSKEGAIMRAIIDLITTEDLQQKYDRDSSARNYSR